MIAYLLFLQNYWMGWLSAFGTIVTGVTWSLAVEEQFYLTAPLAVFRLSRRAVAYALTGILFLAPILRVLARLRLPGTQLSPYVLTPCRADALSVGVLCALLVRTPELWKRVRSSSAIRWSIGALAVPLGFLSYKQYGYEAGIMITFGYSALACFYACCLLLVLGNRVELCRARCV